MFNIQVSLRRLVAVETGEVKALLISCLYFFLILCAYYIIRPIRNEMVIANGVSNIHWLTLMTLVVLIAITPIFGWITSRFKTRQFLSYCTIFFASHLIVFFFLFNVEQRSPMVTRAFYVWVNVFNMFIVSLFWSFMNDIYSRVQAKRLFAFIAAGGTAGAICGPIITASFVETTGLSYLLLIPAAMLSASIICISWLTSWRNRGLEADTKQEGIRNRALKGGALDAFKFIVKSPYLIGIALFIALYAASITFIEIQQAELVASTFDNPIERTKLFSVIDFSANFLALLIQLFITTHLIQRFGLRPNLLLLPVGVTIGFGLIAALPTVAVLVGVEVFRRSCDYAITKPAREMLFSLLSREEKYKAKNFIDTAILRGGNVGGALSYSGIKAVGASAASIAGLSLVLGASWCATAFWLGGQFNKKQDHTAALNNSAKTK